MPYTLLTGRPVKCSATILSIGGINVLAIADDCSLSIDRAVIDVPAAMDTWAQKEQCGGADWTFQIGTLRQANRDFMALMLAGGTCLVSANLDSLTTFYCPGLMTGAQHNWDNPQKQSLTITGFGITPTIT